MKKEKIRYRYKRVINYQEIGWIIIPLIIILFLWNTPILYIFKLFVVLIHEYSHGFAAIVTGGEIISINISANQGGLAITSGGSKLFIHSAGYLGSLLFGIFLLSLSKIKKLNRLLLILLAIIIFSMAMLYMNSLFALGYSVILITIFLALAFFGGKNLRYYFLRFLGVLTILYAVYDIKSDLFFNREINDSILLEGLTGIPAIVWTSIWVILSVIFLYYLFLTRLKKEEIFD